MPGGCPVGQSYFFLPFFLSFFASFFLSFVLATVPPSLDPGSPRATVDRVNQSMRSAAADHAQAEERAVGSSAPQDGAGQRVADELHELDQHDDEEHSRPGHERLEQPVAVLDGEVAE